MRNRMLVFLVAFTLLLGAFAGGSLLFGASAAPAAAPSDVGGQGSEITLLASGSHAGSGAGDWRCDEGQYTTYITEVRLTGTMTGTNPTDSIAVQHSIDHGTSVAGTVNTYAEINATTVPAVQTDARLNGVVIADTPVAYGRCWRVAYTAGGTGTVTANFSVVQYRH